jgi:hypothetical protein
VAVLLTIGFAGLRGRSITSIGGSGRAGGAAPVGGASFTLPSTSSANCTTRSG